MVVLPFQSKVLNSAFFLVGEITVMFAVRPNSPSYDEKLISRLSSSRLQPPNGEGKLPSVKLAQGCLCQFRRCQFMGAGADASIASRPKNKPVSLARDAHYTHSLAPRPTL